MREELVCDPGDSRNPCRVTPGRGPSLLFKCSGVVLGNKRCPDSGPDFTWAWRPVSCRLVFDVRAFNGREVWLFQRRDQGCPCAS